MTSATSHLSIRLPRGEYAEFEEMQSYGETLQLFVREQESMLPQMTDVQHHNEIIDYLQTLADGYNEQLRLFKAVEAQRKQMMLVTHVAFSGG